MKVRLLQNIKGLGQKGDIKDVSEGQARNMLIPRKMAEPVTAQVLNEKKKQDQRKEELHRQEIATKEKRHEILNGATVVITMEKTPQGTLYKHVTKKVIAEAILTQYKIAIKESDIILPDPIEKIGEYAVVLNCLDTTATKIKIHVT